ncbi:MAG: hypothetical protein ABSC56_01635 [Solirubrobacteraceae bacterium]
MRAKAIASALLAAALFAPASIADDLGASGTLETPVHLTLRTHFILYYLQLHTGASQEAFSVQMTPPPFATAGALPEGQSIDGPTDIALQGPGTIGDEVQAPSAIVPCSNRPSAFHGYATGVASVDVLLPADSNTVLAVRYNTGRRAPWVDSDFRLKFTLEPTLVGTYPAGSPFAGGATLTAPMSFTTAGPTVSGRTGAHILLSTSPRQSGANPYAPKAIGAGQSVTISGRLLPAQAGRRIVLQWDRGGGALHTIATVTTRAGGRFGPTSWRPAGRGTYELWASYPAQAGDLVADGTSCPLRFAAG